MKQAPSFSSLSVIIVNYNTFWSTVRCINSLYKDPGSGDIEVILVDNASSECDPKAFKEVLPQIRLIINRENQGFGKAANQGIEAASGSYVLLLNSDCQVKDACLMNCLNFLESPPGKEFDFLGVDMEFPDGEKQKCYFDKGGDRSVKGTLRKGIRKSLIFSKLLSGNSSKAVQKNKDVDGWRFRKVFGLYGAFILLRKNVYLEEGGFDPDFFMYSEDIEWFQKRLEGRYQVGVLLNAEVVHEKEGSARPGFAMRKQKLLSNYLYWYKLGYKNFCLFMTLEWMNLILDFLVLPFFIHDKGKRIAFLAKLFILPTACIRIPKAPNSYGARKRDLRIRAFIPDRTKNLSK